MKGKAAGPVLGGVALWAAACITFRSAVQPPERQVETLLLCRSIVSSSGLYEAVEVQEEFGPEEESVVCFVRLKGISQDTWVRWKWYSPAGRLARDSGEVPIATAGKYLEEVTAFDRLTFGPEPAERPAGEWTVAFFVEDDLAARKTFRLT